MTSPAPETPHEDTGPPLGRIAARARGTVTRPWEPAPTEHDDEEREGLTDG